MKKWMGLVLLVMLVLLAAGCQNQEKKVVIASKPMAKAISLLK